MATRGKVLITDGVHPAMFEGLEQLGFSHEYLPEISLEEVHGIIHQYEGIIVNSKIIAHKELLDKASRLRFIARLGSGMEIIDQDYALEKGIRVFSAPEGNRNAVAEHALAMLLAFANNIPQADAEVRRKHWSREKNRGFELEGKTIGIIGFGHTGSTLGKKLMGMEMRVLAHDKYMTDYTHPYPHIQEASLAEIQAEADIISLHLPLTPETQHFVDADFIQKCRPGVLLVNVARGGLVDTSQMVEALQSQHLSGACLDVFENEKPQTFSPEEEALYDLLYRLPNVILTPHIAGWTRESKYKLSRVILDGLAAWLAE